VRIRTLGGLQISVGDAPVELGRARIPPLLMRVLVALGKTGRRIPQAKIVSELWPESDGDVAVQAFDVTLMRLRKQLRPEGHAAIRLERGHIWLDDAVCWTDVEALEALLNEIHRLDVGRDSQPIPQSITSLTEKLISLYQGPFVDGEDVPPLLRDFDERLRSRVLAAVVAICRRLRDAGDVPAVERLHLHAREADPRLAELLTPLRT
jgi:DNA-binding SARP family transcriptional activator